MPPQMPRTSPCPSPAPLDRSAVDDQRRCVCAAREVVRACDTAVPVLAPMKPERLRCDADDRRVEVQQCEVIAFQPRLEAHVAVGRRAPPLPAQVPLTL